MKLKGHSLKNITFAVTDVKQTNIIFEWWKTDIAFSVLTPEM